MNQPPDQSLNQSELQISSEPVGAGQERICYLHPNDATRLIKLQKGDSDKQTRRELILYAQLARRGMRNYEHIPEYHGRVQTNLGPGLGDVSANYASLGSTAKVILSFAMLMGRLEIFTLLVLFSPEFWRN